MTTDHGRRARRTIKAALAPAWIEFDGAAQVAQLRRTVTKNGKKTVDVVYLITSDRHADPATLAAWVRSHWEIENKLRLVGDVTYQEDKSLVRSGNAPGVMAALRAAWPSTCYACTTTRTSPPPTPTTPATRNGRSSCFRPHERLCRLPVVRPVGDAHLLFALSLLTPLFSLPTAAQGHAATGRQSGRLELAGRRHRATPLRCTAGSSPGRGNERPAGRRGDPVPAHLGTGADAGTVRLLSVVPDSAA